MNILKILSHMQDHGKITGAIFNLGYLPGVIKAL